jgi:hypothetical protein
MAPDMGSPAALMKRINQREGGEAQGGAPKPDGGEGDLYRA